MKKYYIPFKASMLITIFLLMIVSISLCYAQGKQNANDNGEDFLGEYSEPETPSAPNLISALLRTIASLLVVLAIVALGIYAFKKLKGKEIYSDGKPLSVLHKLPVGSKEFICVVEIGEQVLIVGVTSNYISLLSKVEDKDTIDKLRTKSPESISFSSTLMSYLKDRQFGGKGESIDD